MNKKERKKQIDAIIDAGEVITVDKHGNTVELTLEQACDIAPLFHRIRMAINFRKERDKYVAYGKKGGRPTK